MIAYINEDNEIMSVNSFKRVNGGRNLSQSQLKLLGLKKIRIKTVKDLKKNDIVITKKNTNEKGNTNEEK